jgi:hypothetical protein
MVQVSSLLAPAAGASLLQTMQTAAALERGHVVGEPAQAMRAPGLG